MKKRQIEGHVIREVLPGSIAQELEIEPGDVLVSVNGEVPEDVFDYHYLCSDEYVTVLIRKPSGEEWELEIEKEYEDDLGISFENPLLDEYRSCRNKCIFCFIDQMPPGMRPTLYFKDDDSRLSFLQGNYVTLTNMSDHDIDRIIRYHLEPINISFHTMDPGLRVRMLNNRFAGDIFGKVRRLCDAGITINGQIVLCRGINDGDRLEQSMAAFEEYLPSLQSVSVVPVGLTKYREGLYPLEAFTREDACRVLDRIGHWQNYYYEKYGSHLIHASDEWYFLAGRPFPEAETYDGYLQLENGVGMVRLLCDEVAEALEGRSGDARKRRVSLATGTLAGDAIRSLTDRIVRKYPGVTCQVYAVKNRFFGEQITVSGLLTGQDLKEQLAGQDLGEELLLPCNMLRSGEDVFLDDLSVGDLEAFLSVPVRIVPSDGEGFVRSVLGEPPADPADDAKEIS